MGMKNETKTDSRTCRSRNPIFAPLGRDFEGARAPTGAQETAQKWAMGRMGPPEKRAEPAQLAGA